MHVALALATRGATQARRLASTDRRTSNLVEWPKLGSGGFPWHLVSFYPSVAGSTLTISTGKLRIHGDQAYEIEETPLALSGSTEWVYLSHKRDGSSTTFAHSSDEPSTTADELRVPYYRYIMTPDGSYELAAIYHIGDLNIDTPLRNN